MERDSSIQVINAWKCELVKNVKTKTFKNAYAAYANSYFPYLQPGVTF